MDRKQAFAHLLANDWTADVLPIIPPDAKLAEGSSIGPDALGKVPGRQFADGTYGGILRWETLRATEVEIRRWQQSGCNIGLQCRRVRAIDIDCDDVELVGALRRLIEKRFGAAPWRGRGSTPRGALFYRAEPTIGGKIRIAWPGGRVEILGYGNQIVVWGKHRSGTHYEWEGGSVFDRKVAELPLLAEADIALLFDAIAALLHEFGIAASKPSRMGGTIRGGGVRRPLGHPDLVAKDKDQACRALLAIPNTPFVDNEPNEHTATHDAVIPYIAAFMGAVGGDAAYMPTLREWLHQWPKNTDDYISARIESFRDGTEVGADKLFYCAKSWGFPEIPEGEFERIAMPPDEVGEVVGLKKNKVREKVTKLVQGDDESILPASTIVGNEYTDQQLAISCWHAYALSEGMRYDASGRWYIWDTQRWIVDEHNIKATQRIRMALGFISRLMPQSDKSFHLAFRLESAERPERILNILRAAAYIEKWSNDAYWLNTPRGMVNLRTGEWRKAVPTDHVRLITPVTPEDGPPELSLRTIEEIFSGDKMKSQAWIDWMALNVLGVRLRHVALILRGSGRNGKSLLMRMVGAMLGDVTQGGYTCIASAPDEFDLRQRARSDTGRLGLMEGARAVMYMESPNDFKPNEALLKAAIAGESVHAKFIYRPWFDFLFTAGLTFATNTNIEFTSSIPALRSRFYIFDLLRIFPDNEEFTARVLADAPRLLGLVIHRCTEILQGAETFWLPRSWKVNRVLFENLGRRSTEYFDLQYPIPSLLRRLLEKRDGERVMSADISDRLQWALKKTLENCGGNAPKLQEAIDEPPRAFSIKIAEAMQQEFGLRSARIGSDRKGYRGIAWQQHPVLPFTEDEDDFLN